MTNKDTELIGFFIDEASDILVEWESTCFNLENDQSPENWGKLFRMAHNLKGSSKSMGLMEYGDFIHRVEDLIGALRDNKVAFDQNCVKFLLDCQSFQSEWIEALRENPDTLRDPSKLVEKVDAFLNAKPIMVETAETQVAVEETEKRQVIKKTPQESTRIATEKIDSVIKIISEISIYQNIINHQIKSGDVQSEKFQHAIEQNSKLVKELQHVSLSLRMNSVEGMFQRLERIARDVSSELGKEIKVCTIGSEVELDKSVLDGIQDPLTHIIRNAIDHGLENKESRAQVGKTPHGTLIIEARQAPSGVELIVTDDGKGLDQEKLLEKAIAKGLIQSREGMNENSIFEIIMMPGFSTAEKLTNISGRGVGMDIVKKAVEGLQGQIEIRSKLGQGTTFCISLPTNLSIIDVLITKIGETDLAIPIGQVEEVVSVDLENVSEISESQMVIKIRDELIPLEKMEDYFQLGHKKKVQKQTTALIVRTKGKRVAFCVPTIIGKQTVVVRSVGKNFEKMPFYAGATILGNGEPSFIVDLNSLSKHFFQQFVITESDSRGAA